MIASINPATGETLATFPGLTEAEVEDRLARAAKAHRSYRLTTFADWARWLYRAAEILEAEQDRFGRNRGGPALKTGMNSPWDLYLKGNTLYVAQAGHHQIWTLDLDKGVLSPWAGNGRETIEDGALDGRHVEQMLRRLRG